MQINLVTPTPQSFSANLQKRQDLEIQAAARVVATHLTTYWDGKQSVHIESLSTDLNVRKGAIDLAIKAGWAAQYVGDGAYDLAEFPDRLPYKLDANIMVNSTPPIGCIIPTPLFLRSSLETKYIET